jgi:hypothetical protein
LCDYIAALKGGVAGCKVEVFARLNLPSLAGCLASMNRAKLSSGPHGAQDQV